MADKVLTSKEIAAYLRINPQQIKVLVTRGLPAFRLGGKGGWRARQSALDAWLTEQGTTSERQS